MTSSNSDILVTSSPTIRYNDSQNPNPVNYGLECYLCEALLNTEIDRVLIRDAVRDSLSKIINQVQQYSHKSFWGWEIEPSIKNIYFPLDWDDTSKAIDCIQSAYINAMLTKEELDEIQLPGSCLWKNLIERSLFTRKEIGEDKKYLCPFETALTVFFGNNAEMWRMRDDTMVTIVTVRTTLLWYKDVFLELKGEMTDLILRSIFTLNILLEHNKVEFIEVSRYYYSLGHFSYRLIEVLLLLGDKTLLEKVNLDLLQKKIITSKFEHCRNGNCEGENLWWYLIDIKLNKTQNTDEFYLNALSRVDDNQPIFRHRRLNHIYGSEGWLKKLLHLEFLSIKQLANEVY